MDSEEKSSQENQLDARDGPQQKASVQNTSSIPNGGLKAWLQVVAAFFIFFNTWYATLLSEIRILTRYQGSPQHVRDISNVL